MQVDLSSCYLLLCIILSVINFILVNLFCVYKVLVTKNRIAVVALYGGC